MPYPYYGNYMPNYYQPMQNMMNQYQPVQMNQPPVSQNTQQYQPQVQQQQVQATPAQSQNGIIWVQSEAQANEYIVAPNNAVALWDSNNPVIYLKQADASGKPHITTYDLVERSPVANIGAKNNVEYATKEELNALSDRIDSIAQKESRASKRTTAKEDVDNG